MAAVGVEGSSDSAGAAPAGADGESEGKERSLEASRGVHFEQKKKEGADAEEVRVGAPNELPGAVPSPGMSASGGDRALPGADGRRSRLASRRTAKREALREVAQEGDKEAQAELDKVMELQKAWSFRTSWLDEVDTFLRRWAYSVRGPCTIEGVEAAIRDGFIRYLASQGFVVPDERRDELVNLLGTGKALGVEGTRTIPADDKAAITKDLEDTLEQVASAPQDRRKRKKVVMTLSFNFSPFYGEEFFSAVSEGQVKGETADGRVAEGAQGHGLFRAVFIPTRLQAPVKRVMVFYVETAARPYSCGGCDDTFATEAEVADHAEKEHPNSASWTRQIRAFDVGHPDVVLALKKVSWPNRKGEELLYEKSPLRRLKPRGLMAELSHRFWDCALYCEDHREVDTSFAEWHDEAGAVKGIRPVRNPDYTRVRSSQLSKQLESGELVEPMDDLEVQNLDMPFCVDLNAATWDGLLQNNEADVVTFKKMIYRAANDILKVLGEHGHVGSWNHLYERIEGNEEDLARGATPDGEPVVAPFIITELRVEDQVPMTTDALSRAMVGKGRKSATRVSAAERRADGSTTPEFSAMVVVTARPHERSSRRFVSEFYAQDYVSSTTGERFVRVCKVNTGHSASNLRADDIWGVDYVSESLALMKQHFLPGGYTGRMLDVFQRAEAAAKSLQMLIIKKCLVEVGLVAQWSSALLYDDSTSFEGLERTVFDYLLISAPLHVLRRRAHALGMQVAVHPVGLGSNVTEKANRRQISSRLITGRLEEGERERLRRRWKTHHHSSDCGMYEGGFLPKHFLRGSPLKRYKDPEQETDREALTGETIRFLDFTQNQRLALLNHLVSAGRKVRPNGQLDVDFAGAGLNVGEMKADGIVHQAFGVHDKAELHWLGAKWVGLEAAASTSMYEAFSEDGASGCSRWCRAQRTVWLRRYNLLKNQRLIAVYNYLGSSVAYFFMFSNFYTWSLTFPSVVGIIVVVARTVLATQVAATVGNSSILYDNIIISLYCLVLMIWSSFMLEQLRKLTDFYSYVWATSTNSMASEEEPIREQFILSMSREEEKHLRETFLKVYHLPSPDASDPSIRPAAEQTAQVEMETAFRRKNHALSLEKIEDDVSYFNELYYFLPSFQFWRKLRSLVVISLLIAAMASTMLAVLFVPDRLFGQSRFLGVNVTSIASGILNGVLIPVFNYGYNRISTSLTDSEMHRHESRWFKATVFKTAVFAFLNSYISLLYILIVLQDTTRLASQLAGIMLSGQLIGTLRQHGIVQLTHLATKNAKALQARSKRLLCCLRVFGVLTEEAEMQTQEDAAQTGKAKEGTTTITKPLTTSTAYARSNAGLAWRRLQAQNYHDAVSQAALASQPGHSIDDYMELMIQFGYVSMFCSAFPIAPLTAFVNNVVELRLDARKYLLMQKGWNLGVRDIQAWRVILRGLTFMSVVTNVLIIAIIMRDNNNVSRLTSLGKNLDEEDVAWIVIAAEHILFLLKLALGAVLPSVSDKVKEDKYRSAYFAQMVRDNVDLMDPNVSPDARGEADEDDEDDENSSDEDESEDEGATPRRSDDAAGAATALPE